MSLIILYPLWFVLVLFNIKGKKQNLLYTAIVTLYFFSSCASVYLYYFYEDYCEKSINLIAVIFHIITLMMLIAPSKGIERYRHMIFLPSKSNIIKPFTIFIIIIISIQFFANLGSFSISDIISDALSFRNSTVGQGMYNRVSNSLLAYVDILAQEFELVPLALAFYYMKFEPKNGILIIILFLLSLVYPFLSLKVASRDIIIRYIILCISTYYIMYHNIYSSWRTRLPLYMAVVCVLCLFMFVVISVGRFGSDSGYDHGVFDSILNYFGQNFTNFSGTFTEFPEGLFPHNKGSIHFPIIPGTATSSLNLNDIIVTDLSLNTFNTVVGTWIEDCGILRTIIITIIFSVLIRTVANRKTFNVFTLIYVIMIIEFLYASIFYFTEKIYIYKLVCIGILICIDNSSRVKNLT